ncbi:hypothetical protein AX14_003003 [Amanita brunnescens Koide BX004]|nr:hypothetical protein AX14_003003 [Amanita brunnescens Koide BX004]
MAHKLRNIEIVMLVGSTVAILSTATRIILRRRRLWVDDAWAFFSSLALLVQLVAVFLCPPQGSPVGFVRYYLLATAFTVIIWSARLSLLFSLIRVDPHPQRRRFLHYVAVVYVILCILLVFQLVWICQAQPHWKTRPVPQCHLGWQIALFQLITDVVADSSLLITPLLQFRIITDKPLRTRLGVIFSTCIITTVASLVHAVFILTSSGVQVEIAGIMENCVSLVVCNIPVIASALLRLQLSNSRPLLTTLLSTIMFHSNDELQEPQDNPPLG